MANMYINAMTALWNNVGTVYSAIKMNVTNSESAAGSRLIDLQVGSVPMFNADRDGNVYAAGDITALGDLTLGGAILPSTGDTTSLGSSTNPWANLHLGEGAEIRWGPLGGSSDVTLRHATDKLTVQGGDLWVETAGTENQSVVTVAATQTLTNKTLSGGAIQNVTSFSSLDDTNLIGPATATEAGIGRPVTTGSTAICGGGTGTSGGATLKLYGASHATQARDFYLGSDSSGSFGFDRDINMFYFKNNSDTLQMTVGPTGISAWTVKSEAGHYTSDTNVYISPTSGGAIYFRPNGVSSTVDQCYINSVGGFVAGGAITAQGTITATGGSVGMSGTSNYLSMTDTDAGGTGVSKTRHVHHNSNLIGFLGSTGAWIANLNDAGDLKIYGQLNVDSIIQSTDTSMYLCSAASGTIKLRPNGAASAVEEVTINSNGTMTLNPSTSYGLYVNRPTTNGAYAIRSQGMTDAAAVIGYSYGSIYGMLGFYDVLTGADANWSFYGNGNARTSGTWQTSDQRLKSEIADCDCHDAYNKVRRIGVKSYRKENAVRGRDYDEMGFLAQDIEAVIPEAVMDAGIPKSETEERERLGPTVKLTNDHTLLAHLWAAVQHQASIIDDLNIKIEALGGNR